MRQKTVPLVVLLAATAGLVLSVGWAVARADRSDGGWMMSRYGPGMMGYAPSDAGRPVRDLADAKRQAQRFADRLGLEVGEVMRFTNHYYAELVEKDGRLATEVLVDPASGAVSLEYGPAMMWNTRYGMMADFRLRDGGGMMGGSGGMMGGGMMGGGMMGGGMMGGSGGMMGGGMMGGGYADPTWTPGATTADVTPAQARRIAQRWLARQDPELTVGEADEFPGYYTLHVLRAGKVAGMLSVNAATGAVWSHWWHGRFVSMLGE
ncbi:MAG TPA: hypothetical protein VNK94_03705 [Gaiellaceae bacterium]|nr:hypothetical protein [Gaiellaceae bacterium]